MSQSSSASLPNFLGIGAAKAGTTSLAALLADHPEISFPTNGVKELHYFDEHFSSWSLEQYLSHFTSSTASGEFTPSYLYLPECRDRIYSTLGSDLKFIVSLRNPADRAYSHYCHAVNNWGADQYRDLNYPQETAPFAEALAREGSRLASSKFHIRHLSYFSKGLYNRQLEWYFRRFSRDQFFILTLEEFSREPAPILQDLCRFLDVDPKFDFPDPGRRTNKQSDGGLDPDLRSRLLNIYQPSIERLECLLDRDLSIWKDKTSRVNPAPELMRYPGQTGKPVFIVGSPRSGTTLLQCMLAESPEAYSLPETHLFCTVLPEAGISPGEPIPYSCLEGIHAGLKKKLGFSWPDETRQKLEAIAKAGGLTAGRLFELLADSYHPVPGKKLRVIEKTPYHIFFMDEIQSHFPDALFIQVVRDPRDVVSSRIEKAFDNPHPLVHYAEDWNRCLEAADDFTKHNPASLFTVRYEDLVSKPEIMLQRICSFLSLEYKPDMVRKFSNQYQYCTLPTEDRWKSGVSSGQLQDRTGVWQTRISQEEARQIENLTEPYINTMNYAPEKDELMKASQTIKSNNNFQQAVEISRTRIAAFKNLHQGERCVIIGNGPSLNKMDLSWLKDEITFGLNRIYLGFEGWDFRPDYYVSINSLVLEQHHQEILDQINCPKFISQHGIPYFPPDREDVIFLTSLDEPVFSRDPGQGIWEGYTVTYAALQLAFFMGFSEVILIGVDHNFSTKGPANQEVESTGDDPDHFAKDYFGKGARWHLPDLHNSEMAYRLANFVYQTHGRKILDATEGGKLTVFPKVDYHDYLEGKPTPAVEVLDSEPGSERPLVSAIVSTYNAADLIAGCLEDLERQTIADQLEIIVIDSGSQQNEAEIVQEFQARYSNIKYLRTEREPLYDAWNRGVCLAKGKYITNANTDDAHRADALELLAEALEKNPEADLAYSHCAWTSRANDSFPSSHAYRDVHYPPYDPQLAMFFCLLGPHPLWRREVFEKVGLFDNRFRAAGDFDFQFRFAAAGLNAVLVPEILSLFYQNPQGLTLEDNTSDTEALKIYDKYRAQISIDRLYDIDPGKPEQAALAWTALGNQAIQFRPPWEDLPQQDLSYACYCYQRALGAHAGFYPAFHNLVTVLSSVGNWQAAEELLAQAAGSGLDQLKAAVGDRRCLELENAAAPGRVKGPVYQPPQTGQKSLPEVQIQNHQLETIQAPFGFNVIGYLSGRIGLGVTARNVMQALIDQGHPVAGFDIPLEDGRGGAELGELSAVICQTPRDLKYGVNLYVVPPPTVGWLHQETVQYQGGDPRLYTAWSMWELPVIPEEWVPGLEAMDLLIAESDFIRYSFDFNLSGVRSITAPHPLYLPEKINPDRKHFNLPEDGILYLTGFEPLSDPRRKNPLGAVKSFQMALGEEENAHLVVKLNHGSQNGVIHPLAEPLVKECQEHPRIHIIDRSLAYPDVLSLYQSCDVILSLHRSEGLGLVPMEAMRLGKPVIATAWSGNMSYMSYSNSCPVKYRLIQAHGSLPQYSQKTLGAEAVWADPDLDDAALWMRRLYQDQELRISIGEQARTDLEDYQALAARSRFSQEIRQIWDHRLAAACAASSHSISPADSFRDRPDSTRTGPERVLELILEAEDIVAALDRHQAELDPDLLALVEGTIQDARQSGQEELASGLEHLAVYITDRISQADRVI